MNRERIARALVAVAIAAASLRPAAVLARGHDLALYPSPEAAAGSASFPTPATFGETVRSGAYARVHVRHAEIEGSNFSGDVLVERLPRGWQALGIIDEPCFARLRVPSSDADRLLAGITSVDRATSCEGDVTDVGPVADVTAIRQVMQGPFVEAVRVSGRFALGYWYGLGGGVTLFRRDGANWTRITGGGGALRDVDLTNSYGVPAAAACVLAVSPKCAR